MAIPSCHAEAGCCGSLVFTGGHRNGTPIVAAIGVFTLRLVDHALQPHGQQFLHHRLVQHEVGPAWSKYSEPRTLS